MTSPCCGFSLAVSGMMMPPALFSSAPIRLTTTRSWSGRNFISVLLSSSVVLILRGGRKCPLPRRANNKRLHSWNNKRARNVFCPSRMTARRRRLLGGHKIVAGVFLREGQRSRLSQSGSVVDVRLQSASGGVPTRKGRRQARNDPVQQLDHAGFCRRGRTKRGGVPASRHRGCVRKGDRVRARVCHSRKLEA